MVNKTKENRRKYLNTEKYILILLLVVYFTGVYSGCYLVFNEKIDTGFIDNIAGNNFLNTAVFFIAVILLKYSGILSGTMYILPFCSGIQNSVQYCSYILNNGKISYMIILEILRDTSILLLLVIYIILIINQILSKKYNIKKDIRYFSVYISGVIIIYLMEYILKSIIF